MPSPCCLQGQEEEPTLERVIGETGARGKMRAFL